MTAEDIENLAKLGGRRPAVEPGGLHARARVDAGLHRRARDRGPGRHARRHGRPRGRPQPHQPAGAGGARDRPLDPGGRVRRAPRLPAQRRAGVRAQPRALRLPALGTDRLRGLRRGAAQHRHLPSGEPRVPGARGGDPRRAGLPRHAGGHRLPHHHGERPRGARMGRGRDRGRGRDAGPAGVDADPAGRGLPARERAARGRHRHRPGAHGHADAARARRGGQVRGVLRSRAAQPAPGRPGHDREHVARDGRHLRDLPGGRRDAALSRVLRPPGRAGGAGGGLLPGAGALPRARCRGGGVQRHARARPVHGRALPRRAARGRRTAWRSPTRRRTSGPSWAS